MTRLQPAASDTILVAIDIAKHRNEVLIEPTGGAATPPHDQSFLAADPEQLLLGTCTTSADTSGRCEGQQEKAEQGVWPIKTLLGYRNAIGPEGKKIIAVDPETVTSVVRLFQRYATGRLALKDFPNKARAEGFGHPRAAREERRLLIFVLSNCSWEGSEVVVSFRQPFDILAKTTATAARSKARNGGKSARSEIWLGDLDSNQD